MNRNLIYSLLFLLSTVVVISCQKEYSLETGISTKARGTLHDTGANCYASQVRGDYYSGVNVRSSEYIELQVNVTTPGSYNIASDTVNGFSFKNAGVFTSTGLQTIKLQASGRPSQVQVTNFFISFDTTICLFSVNVEDSTGSGGGGGSDTAWTFTEGGKKYNGYIDTAFTFDTTIAGIPFRTLTIQGVTASSGDSVFLIGIAFPGGTVTTGSFPSATTGFFQFLGSFNPNDTLYSATFEIPTVNTTIVISSYDANTRIVKGTFSGTAKNKSGGTVNITQGRFEAKLN